MHNEMEGTLPPEATLRAMPLVPSSGFLWQKLLSCGAEAHGTENAVELYSLKGDQYMTKAYKAF